LTAIAIVAVDVLTAIGDAVPADAAWADHAANRARFR